MAISLFTEYRPDGLTFYINGDLQFCTADEAIYHEYLAVPALALAEQRFPDAPLRVLICGGGDGLLARDVLRFSSVAHIDLVDRSPEVIALGRTTFRAFNLGSLDAPRLQVHPEEAFGFVQAVPDAHYHVVLCDFTYPSCAADADVYSCEWFAALQRLNVAGGILATNGVSPELRSTGFWCLYQTLRAAGWHARPLHLDIPSFAENGYGRWGFFLASTVPIRRDELGGLLFPPNLRALQADWTGCFIFDSANAARRFEPPHRLACPQLFYRLLNPLPPVYAGLPLDFLDLEETALPVEADVDPLQLESVARAWLDGARLTDPLDPAKLLPVQHRYHSPKMAAEWLTSAKDLLSHVNLPRLLQALLARAHRLPPGMATDLRTLASRPHTGGPIEHSLLTSTTHLTASLAAVLLTANLAIPDAAFAKGGGSGGSDGTSVGPAEFGGLLILAGAAWLAVLYAESEER